MGEGEVVAVGEGVEREGAGAEAGKVLAWGRGVGGPAGSVRFSAKVARRICMRLESGETLRAICRDVEMPHRETVRQWAAKAPKFALAMERSLTAAGWQSDGGRKPVWDETSAAMICARVAAGEGLSRICEDPDMPSLAMVYRWRATRADFAGALALARQTLAERFFDLGWEIAQAVTPETAYATRVKLGHLRWTVAGLAPTRFGKVRPLDADAETEVRLLPQPPPPPPPTQTLLLRRFLIEKRAEDGALRVVGFSPDPETGQMVRDNDPPWEPAPPGDWVQRPPWNGNPEGGTPTGPYYPTRDPGAGPEGGG